LLRLLLLLLLLLLIIKGFFDFFGCLFADVNNVKIRIYRGRITYGQEERQQLNPIVVIVQKKIIVCPSRVIVVVVDALSSLSSSFSYLKETYHTYIHI